MGFSFLDIKVSFYRICIVEKANVSIDTKIKFTIVRGFSKLYVLISVCG